MNRRHFFAATVGALCVPFVARPKAQECVFLIRDISLADYQRQFNLMESERMDRDFCWASGGYLEHGRY